MTEEFQGLEAEWAGIVQRQDQAAAERFLADDYVLTSVGGVSRHMPRENWIASLPSIETELLEADVEDVRTYGRRRDREGPAPVAGSHRRAQSERHVRRDRRVHQRPGALEGVLADLGPPHRPVTVLLEREEPIAVVRLNRPEALNALSNQLMSELVGALENLDDDDAVRCIVIAGDEKAFASGADIGELSDSTPLELYFGGRIDKWDAIRSVRTPIVAAVSGYCLGGGCELAMACDLIVASETAQFGQPETNLGVLPGAGGTQRMTRAIGKSKAMDVILTGRFLTAREAEAAGLVARVVAAEAWLDEAKRVAQAIAAKSPVGVRLAKEAVNQAFETNLRAGLDAERKAFHLALSSEDAQEGMKAFLEKRHA